MVLSFVCTDRGTHAPTNLGTYFPEGVLGAAGRLAQIRHHGAGWNCPNVPRQVSPRITAVCL
jgi:hypothetical protein